MPIKTLTKTSPKMSVKTRAKTSIRKLTKTPAGIAVSHTKTSKAGQPSGATVALIKSGGFRLRAYGPDAPDLRTVIPELLKSRGELGPDDDEECRTCLGNGRIRDGETGDLRRCLDCGGTGTSA